MCVADVKPPIVDYKKEVLITRLETMAAENEEGKCVEVIHSTSRILTVICVRLGPDHAGVHVGQSQTSNWHLCRYSEGDCWNCQVKNRQLFGDLIYTHDSDLVAVLMHLGYFRMMDTTPIGMVNVKAILRLVPNPPVYPGHLRNNLLSRTWHISTTPNKKKGCGFKV